MFKKRKIIFLLLYVLLLVSCDVMAGRRTVSQEAAQTPATPTATPKGLLKEKIKGTEEIAQVGTGWYDARLITFGTHFYLKEDDGTYALRQQESDSVTLKLYQKDPAQNSTETSSHSLLMSSTGSLGVSVDTSVHTQTERKKEKKKTFIQYDKEDVDQKDKDFEVDAVNNRGRVNYDGGHLVDHKFSAQGSHTNACNYIPQHYYYNHWLKEEIVKNASGYLEIPLFTPNSPRIKVKGEERYDAISIGILLVTFADHKIRDAYYFPNNQYNYRQLEESLGLKGVAGKTKKIADIFRLKPIFHKLLLPAIVYNLKYKDTALAKQIAQELQGANTTDELVEGMSTLNLGEEDVEEGAIAILASNVFHQADVKLSNILSINKSVSKKMELNQANHKALSHSFNVLGQFLIEYAIHNALKSEVLSINSRIMFANIITDFIEYDSEVSKEATAMVYLTFKDTYEATLKDLWKKKSSMSLKDIIYFANLYQKLSSSFMYDHFYEHKLLENIEYDECVTRFIEILKELTNNQLKYETPSKSQMQNLVDLFLEAQNSLEYLIDIGFPDEEFEGQFSFLKMVKPQVKEWNKQSSSPSGSYQTSPNSGISFREVEGLSKMRIECLDTNSSFTHNNSDSEDADPDPDPDPDPETE